MQCAVYIVQIAGIYFVIFQSCLAIKFANLLLLVQIVTVGVDMFCGIVDWICESIFR